MDALGYPATWPTSCFIDGGCGETVFAHTNGFGDFVLFDELGPPWPIHECYLRRFAPSSTAPLAASIRPIRSSPYASAIIKGTPPPKKLDLKKISRVAPEALLGKGYMLIAGYVQDYVERRADRLTKGLGHLGQQLFRSALGNARSQVTVITTKLESYTFFADLSRIVVRPKDMIVARIRSTALPGIPGQKAVLVASDFRVVHATESMS